MGRFDPDWCVAPGATLAEWIELRESTPADAISALEISLADFDGLLIGDTHITPELAERLHAWTMISASFWLKAERLYRDGLAAGKRPVVSRFTPR